MIVTINCAAIESMREFHDIMAREFHFPDWYGKNLDALYDCLTDLTEPCTLTLTNTLSWFEMLGNDAITVVRVLQDVSQINANFKFCFASDTAE